MFASILFALSTTSAPLIANEVRLEQLFKAWQIAQNNTRSLVVQFTLAWADTAWRGSNARKGTFKLRYDRSGTILARCDVADNILGNSLRSALLIGHKCYLLELDEKTAARINLCGHSVPHFLARFYNPFMVLLDKEFARKNYRLQVYKRDEWYTYVRLTSQEGKGPANFSNQIFGLSKSFVGLIALQNSDSNTIPKNMPAAMAWIDALGSMQRCDIQEWQPNGPKALLLSEFEAPEKMSGWKVSDLNQMIDFSPEGPGLLPANK